MSTSPSAHLPWSPRLVSDVQLPPEPDPAEHQIDLERRAGIRLALTYIAAGNRGRAHYVMARSLQRQARIAGLGTQPVVTACPCGGRCQSGGAR